MFYRYEIKNNGKEDILYLYLSMNYEFSKELINNSSLNDLTRRTKNFINTNNIDFKGDKVFLVVDGIIVKTINVDYSKDIEILNNKLMFSNDYYLVTVKQDDTSIIEITLKEYLRGVLATILFSGIEYNTLCCLAIMFRTYAYYSMDENHYILSNDKYANFKDISYYKLSWIDNYDEILKLIDKAIDATDCLFLTYNRKYILPFIHFSNCAKTVSNSNYPYLSSVKSLWDLTSPYYVEYNDYNYKTIGQLLNVDIDSSTDISIIEMDSYKQVKLIKINDKVFTGEEIKETLNLKSLRIIFILFSNKLRIITKGNGNFMGLSIYGANTLAHDGCSFLSILKYFFPKVTINKYIKELSK